MKRRYIPRVAVAAFTLCALALTPLYTSAQKGASKVTIRNQSNWDIHHLFMSPVDKDTWGPDQLGEEVISKGESFMLHSIPCDSYDVKIVDDDGDECIVEDVDLCRDNATWTITNKDLLECEGFGD